MPLWLPRQRERQLRLVARRRRYLRVPAITFEPFDGSFLMVVEEIARAIDGRERCDGDKEDRGWIISYLSSGPISSERVNEKTAEVRIGYNLPQSSENSRL